MANLLDGVKNVGKDEIAKQICDFQVYRIPVMLHIVWQCVYYVLVYILRLVLHLFKKEITLPVIASWEDRYKSQYEKNVLLDTKGMKDELIQWLKKRVRLFGMYSDKSEDKLSSEITRFVTKLYGKTELMGLSVGEKNHYIFQKYPHQKKIDEKLYLYIWFIVSFFIFGVAVIFFISEKDYKNIIVLFCFILEILWGCYVTYKINQWQLAHFVWLAMSGAGNFVSATKERSSGNSATKKNRERNAKELWAYHTMLSMRDSIVKNQTKLSDSTSFQTQIAILSDMIDVRERREMDKLKHLWEIQFPQIEFKQESLKQIIQGFSYDDFGQIEQRLSELSQAKDPFVLAERKKSEYKILFRTVQGDIAAIFFGASKNKYKRISICHVERKGVLKEKPMPTNELKQFLKEKDMGISEVYQEFLETLAAKEHILAELKKSEESVRSQRYEAEKQLQNKASRSSRLSEKTEAKQRECEELRTELSKVIIDDKEHEKLKKAYLHNKGEMAVLKNESDRLEEEMQNTIREYEDLTKEKDKLNKEIIQLNREICQEHRWFIDKIEEAAVEKKKVVKQIEKKLLEKKSLIEKGEREEYISTLRSNIVNLKESVSFYEEELEEAQGALSYLLEKRAEVEEKIKQAEK